MNIKKLFSTHNFKLSLVLLISEDVCRKFAKRSSRHFYAYTIKHLLFTYYSWVQSPTEEGIFPQVEYRFLFRQQFPSLQLQVPSVKIWMQSKQTNLQEVGLVTGERGITTPTITDTYASSIILFAFLESNIPTKQKRTKISLKTDFFYLKYAYL